MSEVCVVSFYRRIIAGNGLSYLSRIDSIEVGDAVSGKDASIAAIKAFERKHNVTDWQELADRYRFDLSGYVADTPESEAA